MKSKMELTESWITENIKEIERLPPEDYKNFDFPRNIEKVFTSFKGGIIYGIFIVEYSQAFFYFEYIYKKDEKRYIENILKEITDIDSLNEIWKERHGVVVSQ